MHYKNIKLIIKKTTQKTISKLETAFQKTEKGYLKSSIKRSGRPI